MFDLEIYEIINILGLFIGIAFGVIAQKNQFCFSGSIKDYILTKSTKRAASVVMAMIVAIVATTIMANHFEIDLTQTNYFKSNINYFSIIFGGLLFGSGMMIADGCSSRSLVKFAQGDSNALVTLIFIGIFAYATVKGLLAGFLNPFTNNETLIQWSSAIENTQMNIYIVIGILTVILLLLVKKVKRILTLVDGMLIGLLVSIAWYVTGVMGEESLERTIELSSITFVYPIAKTLELFTYYQVNEIAFAITLVCGVLIGTFAMSFINRKYSFGCTANQNMNKVKYNMIGGSLMGVGGVLAIGCTVGQGLTGFSTLAFASLLAISSIFISGYITAVILGKKDKLPMCFIFEWNDDKTNKPIDFQI
ncbi:YeeE/YedE family protein [Arcobacter sp. s6]|uniref:YeeE/YedE family protein n=1 Tax=Arcobacter sp. s6 TaxID=3230363 RepID=UPI0034A0587B